MPRSAIEAGCVDFVLPPAQIAQRLAKIGAHPYLSPTSDVEDAGRPDDGDQSVLTAFVEATGVNFAQYKDSTIRRRINRRMAVAGLDSVDEYARKLMNNPAEIDTLYRDLLINVTSFFRDRKMFEPLKAKILPELMKERRPNAPLRIWVPGCASGHEAYSLAMTAWEYFDDQPMRPPLQIFATDLSEAPSLERARSGLYPETIEAEVSAERLRRIFKREDHQYRIDKRIRDACIFARQNLAADPPFSHVDVISCRNVLIYMASPLQKRLLPMFHYALNVPGFLILGSAETVGEFTDLFETTDRANKIYSKKALAGRAPPYLAAEDSSALTAAGTLRRLPGTLKPADFQREADRLVVARYAPAGMLVNDNFDIIQFRDDTQPYLALPPGEATTNVLKLAREGFVHGIA